MHCGVNSADNESHRFFHRKCKQFGLVKSKSFQINLYEMRIEGGIQIASDSTHNICYLAHRVAVQCFPRSYSRCGQSRMECGKIDADESEIEIANNDDASVVRPSLVSAIPSNGQNRIENRTEEMEELKNEWRHQMDEKNCCRSGMKNRVAIRGMKKLQRQKNSSSGVLFSLFVVFLRSFCVVFFSYFFFWLVSSRNAHSLFAYSRLHSHPQHTQSDSSVPVAEATRNLCSCARVPLAIKKKKKTLLRHRRQLLYTFSCRTRNTASSIHKHRHIRDTYSVQRPHIASLAHRHQTYESPETTKRTKCMLAYFILCSCVRMFVWWCACASQHCSTA